MRTSVRTTLLSTLSTLFCAACASSLPPSSHQVPVARFGGSSSTRSTLNCTGVKAIHPSCASVETGYKRDVFYVGGRYINSTDGEFAADQLYVEKLTPLGGVSQPYPLVFFHGGGVSGTSWLNTPDNRPGFASYFIGQGYQVYVLDEVAVGRSTEMNTRIFPMLGDASFTVGLVEGFYTAPQNFDFYPQAALHTQWPGTGLQGDPYFDQFHKSHLPYLGNNTSGEEAMRASGCELLNLIGPSYLISHSIGAIYPLLLSNDCGALIVGSINLESATSPFRSYGVARNKRTAARAWGITNTAVTYAPPITDPSELVVVEVGSDTLAQRSCFLQDASVGSVRLLPAINAVRFLQVTSEASVHATYDHCLIQFLQQTGGAPDWVRLQDVGIKGNGHFMHIELNNMEIAKVVEGWIIKTNGNFTVA